jgi:Ca2+-binding RTX toxin-like protein
VADITLYGHRGGGDPYPDHSLESYTWGINWGADFAEPDLYLTKDGVLVASHDNIAGGFANVTYAQALAQNPALLTFDQVIELVKAQSIETGRDIGIIPETKSTDYATSEAVVKALIAHDFTDPSRVVIQSFSATNLRQLHDTIMPQYGVDFRLAQLGTGIVNPANIASYADIVAPSVGSFSAADVAAAHAAGLQVVAWTLAGAQSDIQKLVDMNVDGVFVDNMQMARPGEAAIEGLRVAYGTAQSDTVSSGSGEDLVYAMQGDDLVRAGAGNDTVYGDGGNDLLFGAAGNDALVGGAGTDFLSGGDGADVLDGSAGNDVVVATGDRVLFRAGSGIDLVSLDGTSTVGFADIRSTDVTVLRDGANLIIRAGDDALVIRNAAGDAAARPASIAFSDGVTWTGLELASQATAGTDSRVSAALPQLENLLATAPALAEGPPEPVNLIANGGFEDLTGANDGATWGYRNTNPAGVIAGWVNTGDTRAEVHKDSVGGVSATEGTYWFDMEGAPKNARLVQSVSGIEQGQTYQLKFSIADTDTAQASDTVRVSWGNQVIYTGKPKASWQEITIDVVGGAGDGSNKLVFESVTASPNGAGVALDNVSMIRIDKNPNLIVNGSFEDLTGANDLVSSWGYRNTSPNGVIPGWTQTNMSAGGRAELHWDTHDGVSAKEGRIWFDLDGNRNNARLVQNVAGVEAGETYDLVFSIADQDASTSDDGVRVFWGGQVVYEGRPGQAWETIRLQVAGGAGNGSNQLVFEGTETNLNGYGVALDGVSLRKAVPAPTEGDDELTGTAEDDVIAALGGNDVVLALAGNDIVDGGAGNDRLDGGEGDDVLRGGAGDDLIDGGTGFDTLDLSDATGPVSVDLAAGRVSGAGIGTDSFAGIEKLVLGSGHDTVTGGSGDDAFDGGTGNDTLKGAGGDDTLAGGAGDDTLDGGAGHDRLDGGIGADVLKAGSGDDRIDAGDGNDVVDAGSGDDIILAGTGDDRVDAGSGDDRIEGGAGTDVLTGGSGHDVFVFAAGFGRDTVTDFRTTGASSDVLEFSTDVFADFCTAIAAADQVGADTVFTLDGGQALTLSNVQLTSLQSDDFRFV